MYRKLFKRIFDIFLSSAGILIALPLGLIFSLGIWFEDRGPIFYLQDRAGKDGEIFKSIKFRSMKRDAEKETGPIQARENDPRVTKIGMFLRKTAMDELPQLINIFKADMSFVGPRALRPVEVELTEDGKPRDIFHISGFKKRSSVTPGLTGAAQVFASRKILREEKFQYDIWYIDNMSFWLDLKLIVSSILITIKARWEK